MPAVSLGLDRLVASPPEYLHGRRIGLLCNAASVGSDLKHAASLCHTLFGDRLKALYTPQHGLYAEKQDNMVESENRRHPTLPIPVYSLYSDTRIPTRAMLDPIDTLLVDLQDVGTRVYTFIYTLSYCMEAAREHDVNIVVLDRPNPIGGRLIEGNCLKPPWTSFVGRYPLPMRHGLTIGELARLFNEAFDIGCELEVIAMTQWRRDMLQPQTGLAWIAPSPNLPSPMSALVYPGQVIWEGTCVSEGRGTTQPFELFGAPFIDPQRILDLVGGPDLPGVFLRPVEFEPTANKWQGQRCRGFQIHVTDAGIFRPYRTSLKLLGAVIRAHPQAFTWKQPPYEYEYDRMPIDLILGDDALRLGLEAGEAVEDLESRWSDELSEFDDLRRQFFLYPEQRL